MTEIISESRKNLLRPKAVTSSSRKKSDASSEENSSLRGHREKFKSPYYFPNWKCFCRVWTLSLWKHSMFQSLWKSNHLRGCNCKISLKALTFNNFYFCLLCFRNWKHSVGGQLNPPFPEVISMGSSSMKLRRPLLMV